MAAKTPETTTTNATTDMADISRSTPDDTSISQCSTSHLPRGKSETLHQTEKSPRTMPSLPDLSRLKFMYSAIDGISRYDHTTDPDIVINILSCNPDISVLYMTPHLPHNHQDYSPYIMHLVAPGSCDVSNYCVVARSGVTRYIKGKKPKHLSLARWRFEQSAMLKMRQKRFFKQFKMMKAFQQLAAGSQDMSKLGVSRRRLRSRLLACVPTFSDTLLLARRFCLDMAGVSMAGFSGLSDPELTYTLAESVQEKKHFASDLVANLKRVHVCVSRVTSRHCWDDVIKAGLAMDRDAEVKVGGEVKKRQKETPRHDTRAGTWCTWPNPGKQQEMEAEATEHCSRLARLIYLIDCLQQDALHSVVARYFDCTRRHLLFHASLLPSEEYIRRLVREYVADMELPDVDVGGDDNDDGKGGGGGASGLNAGGKEGGGGRGSRGGEEKKNGFDDDGANNEDGGGNVGGNTYSGNVSRRRSSGGGYVADDNSETGAANDMDNYESSQESLMQRIEEMLRSNHGGGNGAAMMGHIMNLATVQQQIIADFSDSISFSFSSTDNTEGEDTTEHVPAVSGQQRIDGVLLGPSFPLTSDASLSAYSTASVSLHRQHEDAHLPPVNLPVNILSRSSSTMTSDDIDVSLGNEMDVNTSAPNDAARCEQPNSPNQKETSQESNTTKTGLTSNEQENNLGAKGNVTKAVSAHKNVSRSNNSNALTRDPSSDDQVPQTVESTPDLAMSSAASSTPITKSVPESRLSEVFEKLLQDVVEPSYPVTTCLSALEGLEFPILDARMWQLEDVELCLKITRSSFSDTKSPEGIDPLPDISASVSNLVTIDNSMTECVIKPSVKDGRGIPAASPVDLKTFPVCPDQLKEYLDLAQDELYVRRSPPSPVSTASRHISASDYTSGSISSQNPSQSQSQIVSVIGGNIFDSGGVGGIRRTSSDLVARRMKSKNSPGIVTKKNSSPDAPHRTPTTPRTHLSKAVDVGGLKMVKDKRPAQFIPEEETPHPSREPAETARTRTLNDLDNLTAGEIQKLLLIRINSHSNSLNQDKQTRGPTTTPFSGFYRRTGSVASESEKISKRDSDIGISYNYGGMISRGDSSGEFVSASENLYSPESPDKHPGQCRSSHGGGGNCGCPCSVGGGGGGGGGGQVEALQLSDRNKPMFHISLRLENNEMVYVPALSEFTSAAFKMIHAVEEHVAGLPNLTDSQIFHQFLDKANPHRESGDKGWAMSGPNLARNLLTDMSIEQAKTSIYSSHKQVVQLANVYRQEMESIYTRYFKVRNMTDVTNDLDTFCKMLQLHEAQTKILDRLPESQVLGMYFLVDLSQFRDHLIKTSQDMLARIGRDISAEVFRRNQVLARKLSEFEDIFEIHTRSLPSETDSAFHILVTTDDIDRILATLYSEHASHLAALYELIDRYQVAYPDYERDAFMSSTRRIEDVRSAARRATEKRKDILDKLEEYTDKDVALVESQVTEVLEPLVKRPWLLDGAADVTALMRALTDTENVVRTYVRRATFLRHVERYLKRSSSSEFGDLFSLASRHVNTRNLWLLMADWDRKVEAWKHQDFNNLNILEINQYTFRYIQAVDKLGKVLPRNSVVALFRDKMDQMLRWLNFIIEFRGNSVKPRHWRQIEAVLGVEFGEAYPHNLANLMAADAIGKQKKLHAIITKAKAESNVQYEFDEAKQRVDSLVVPIRQRMKSLLEGDQPVTVYTLGETFEIEESLNFFTMEMERIDSSPHAAFLHDQLQDIVLSVFEMMENLVNVGEMAERVERLRRMVMRHPEIQEASRDLLTRYREVYVGVSSFLQTLGRGSGLAQWSNSQPMRDFVTHYHRMINDTYRAIKRYIDSRTEPGNSHQEMFIFDNL